MVSLGRLVEVGVTEVAELEAHSATTYFIAVYGR